MAITPTIVNSPSPPAPFRHRRLTGPRCGARTRAGHPCGQPALPNGRCRLYGGRSTGPRTQAGLDRPRALSTVHGRYDAAARTSCRQLRTIGARPQAHLDALRYQHRLPAELAARLHPTPPEFAFPPYPSVNLTAAQDRAMQQAEAKALAPWRQAIAAIREADRLARPAKAAQADDAAGGRSRPATACQLVTAASATGQVRQRCSSETPMRLAEQPGAQNGVRTSCQAVVAATAIARRACPWGTPSSRRARASKKMEPQMHTDGPCLPTTAPTPQAP